MRIYRAHVTNPAIPLDPLLLTVSCFVYIFYIFEDIYQTPIDKLLPNPKRTAGVEVTLNRKEKQSFLTPLVALTESWAGTSDECQHL